MTKSELEQYLHEHIPLSKAMQVSILELQDESIVLGAPLAPNINHRETVFGGSASAVAILAAWALLHTGLRRAGIESRLVIQSNTMDYELPIAGAFTARATLSEKDAWERFIRMLSRRGKARISISSILEHGGAVVGRLTGEFVALGNGIDARSV